MARFIKSRKKSHGTMPGSLIFIGNKKMEKTEIHLMQYNRDTKTERLVENAEDLETAVTADSVLWINVYGLQDTALIGSLGERFSIHPLELEDILNTDQRPKVTQTGKNLTFILKVLEYHEDSGKVTGDQVSIILRGNMVITFQEKRGHHFDPVRERIRSNQGRIRSSGAELPGVCTH